MPGWQRREFLAAGGLAAAAAMAAARASEAGDASFGNNVPDPLLAGKELPLFRYALEKAEAKVIGGSSAREATVEEFPVSRGIAGVSMQLAPGAMRELHWHATAAEWAYVNRGRVRTTVFGPDGTAETDDFEPGDVWYFPRGHGHMLECLGDEPCHVVLIFDDGCFSEFGTFSISDWIARTPRALLAKNFGLPESAFDGFPEEEVYFARGAIPPARAADPVGRPRPSPLPHRWQPLRNDPIVDGAGGRLYRVDSTRFPIARTIAGAVLELEPGALRGLHWHPNADEWQYVLDGRVSLAVFGSHGRFRAEVLEAGDVGYVPQGYGHSIENVGDRRCRVLIGFNAGVYEDIDLAEWIGANPPDVLATNFGRPAGLFGNLPRRGAYIAPRGGP